MSKSKSESFAPRGSKEAIESSLELQPKFDADGLIPAIVTDAGSGEVLMFAWMNAQALALTIETKLAHFWSRSRGALWKKGGESGNLLAVAEMKVDCDQDVVWLRVNVAGDGLIFHNGKSGRVDLARSGNTVTATTRGVKEFTLLLSPDQFDFDKSVRVVVNGRVVFDGRVEKSVATLQKWAARDNDRAMLFAAELRIKP